MPVDPWLLAPLVLVAATLYAAVGHGGATMYLAILVLAGYSVAAIAPAVLVLNVIVAGLAFWSYRAGGHFDARLLWPFVLPAIPAAFLGGALDLAPFVREALLGAALVVVGFRFLVLSPSRATARRREAPRLVAALAGAVLGFLAGATGIGGGVFLTPLLLLAGWAEPKQAAAVSAAFIVLNSLSGLAGQFLRGAPFEWALFLPLAAAALVGGFTGSRLGAFRFTPHGLRMALGVVLVLAGLKGLVV